jgi:hypothetical protein
MKILIDSNINGIKRHSKGSAKFPKICTELRLQEILQAAYAAFWMT